jgi:hypothetical protein
MHRQGQRRLRPDLRAGQRQDQRPAAQQPQAHPLHELTEDEYFCTEDGAKAGVTFENTSETEPLVVLRYFGPR